MLVLPRIVVRILEALPLPSAVMASLLLACLAVMASLLVAPLPAYAEAFLVMDKAVEIQADSQTYDALLQESTFTGNVIVTSGAMVIHCNNGWVRLDANNQPQEAHFKGSVRITKGGDTLLAPEARFDFNKKLFTALGGVHSETHAGSQGLTTVDATVQKFDQLSNQLFAQGNVRIRTKDTTATAGQALLILNAAQEAERLNLIGSAVVVQPSGTVSAQRITVEPKRQIFMAEGAAHTRLKQAGKPDVLLDSNYQEFDQAAQRMVGSGRVHLVYEEYDAKGPKAVFTFKPKTAAGSSSIDKAVFSGRSTIRETSKQVTADIITITATPRHFDARGRVQTILLQAPKTATAKPTKPTTSVVMKPAPISKNPALAVGQSHVQTEDEEFNTDRFQ